MLRIVHEADPTFAKTVRALATRGEGDLSSVEPAVRAILDDVRARGDQAVLDACEAFEHRRPSPLLKTIDGAAALARLPAEARAALELAAARITAFHRHQVDRGFRYQEAGATLGTRVRPLLAPGTATGTR